ncbi:short-chain alcohol dehydrogenase [Colletotrichum sp. CLE4]
MATPVSTEDGNAKIWLAARSQSKTQAVIDEIKAAHSGSSGDMIFLKRELDDLATIIATVQESLSRENRLDVLWNNAGVMVSLKARRQCRVTSYN